VLMVHDNMGNIVRLAKALPAELGVDVILSGHNHLMFEQPSDDYPHEFRTLFGCRANPKIFYGNNIQ